MKVFLSWSGTKSRLAAGAVKTFLQDVNQRTIAWFSEADISAGERWGSVLASELEGTHYGIICVTQESLESKWMLFEAGALSKSVMGGRVCPYLIDVTPERLTGPLSQFQAKEANKNGTWELLNSVNLTMGDEALPEVRLRRYFDTFWPGLEEDIESINSQFRPLPLDVRSGLIEMLAQIYYETYRIEFIAADSELPIWRVNVNQAAIYVWRELIQIAVDEGKLEQLVDTVLKEYPGNRKLADLRHKIRAWSEE